jgi:hypothetical protein
LYANVSCDPCNDYFFSHISKWNGQLWLGKLPPAFGFHSIFNAEIPCACDQVAIGLDFQDFPHQNVPPVTPPVAVKTPVDGLNLSLVDDTLIGKFPVVVVTQDKYISAAVLVSSVIATFVAFVAVPAVVADPAEPSMFTPVKDCALLDRFSAIAVVPTYRLEFPKTPLGIVPDN